MAISLTDGLRTGVRQGIRLSVAARSAYDAAAVAYFTAVETADGQTLETGVKVAINNFIIGCKADGTWNAIKASCILAGARTLSGALVPLAGTAPTNNNFVSGDYNRRTGLVGDGSTKYLNSNRNNNADPQNSQHASVHVTTAGTASTSRTLVSTPYPTGAGPFTSIASNASNALFFCSRNENVTSNIYAAPAGSSTGFIGVNRSVGTNFNARFGGINRPDIGDANSSSSRAPDAGTFAVFARPQPTPILFADARLSFYSIGEALDLALLDARVTRLMAELAFSINTGLVGSSYDLDTLNYINGGYAAGGTLA